MKLLSIAAAGATLVLIAFTLAPAAGDYRGYLAIGAVVCSIVALATIVVGWRERPARADVRTSPAPQSQASAAASPPVAKAVPPPKAVSAQAEVTALLAVLQEKGRLVDFVQDDITGYSDAQVGAAARVVHQGCKSVLDEYFRIVPVRTEHEGAKVTVPSGYAVDEYRLVGKLAGQAPFAGTLTHRGWKTESVNLPRVLRPDDQRLPTIAPAEVELG